MRQAAVLRAALLALAFAVKGAASVSVDLENGVLVLLDSNFDTALEKFPNLMVQFYAPWCGHCKEMKPAYERAAKNLKKRTPAPARLAKVDATAERTLAKKYEVKGYPTILVFKNGELFEQYEAGRDKQDFVDYMVSLDMDPYLGAVVRAFYKARGIFKEAIKQTPIPKRFHAYVDLVMVAMIALPILALTTQGLYLFAGKKPPAPEDKKAGTPEATRGRGAEAGGKPTRSASPANRAKAEGEKAAADAPAKDADAKKLE